MQLHRFALILTVGVATAMPALFSGDSLPMSLAGRSLTADEMHANVLRAWPVDKVIESRGLEKYIAENPAAAGSTVYLKDRRSFTELPANLTLGTRETCRTTTSRYVLRTQEIWDPWEPLTSCLKTDKAPNGGYITMSVEFSKSSSWDAG